MTQLYDNIASGAIASWDVSGISQAYNHLKLVITARGDDAATAHGLYMRLNNDSGSNYVSQLTYSNNASAAGQNSQGTEMVIGDVTCATSDANAAVTVELLIPNYALTTFNKAVLIQGSLVEGSYGSSYYTRDGGGNWKSTAAINRITIYGGSTNFIAGSRLTIYGLL